MRRKLTLEVINRLLSKDSRLTAHGSFITKNRKKFVWCKCSCGNEICARVDELVCDRRISCGCFTRRTGRPLVAGSLPSIRQRYRNMINRCYNKTCKSYKNYGAIGVEVCEEWKNGYEPFLKWALANGFDPKLDLDKDKKGTGYLYSPEYCCFITRSENNRYRKSIRKFKYHNKLLTLWQISCIVNISVHLLASRIYDGKSISEAILLGTSVSYPFRKKIEYDGEKLSIPEICKLEGFSYKRVNKRMKKTGCSVQEAIAKFKEFPKVERSIRGKNKCVYNYYGTLLNMSQIADIEGLTKHKLRYLVKVKNMNILDAVKFLKNK